MRVGVLIPTYNEGEKMSLCLNSLLQQTLRPVQVIVCDGGSTDNTREITRNILNDDENIQFHIIFEPRNPLIGKWNISFAYWRACHYLKKDLDLVACLEADIILDENYYEVLAHEFEDPRLGIACGEKLPYGFPDSPFPLPESWKNKVTWGANRVYRFSCWLDLNSAVDMRLLPAWDTDHSVLAAVRGWKIGQFREAVSWNIRPVNPSRGFSKGMMNRFTGYPYWWNLYKALKTVDPYLLLGYACMAIWGGSSPLKKVYKEAITFELGRVVRNQLLFNKVNKGDNSFDKSRVKGHLSFHNPHTRSLNTVKSFCEGINTLL